MSELVDGPQECCQCLSGAGRSVDQRVRTGLDRIPPAELRVGGMREGIGEPAAGWFREAIGRQHPDRLPNAHCAR